MIWEQSLAKASTSLPRQTSCGIPPRSTDSGLVHSATCQYPAGTPTWSHMIFFMPTLHLQTAEYDESPLVALHLISKSSMSSLIAPIQNLNPAQAGVHCAFVVVIDVWTYRVPAAVGFEFIPGSDELAFASGWLGDVATDILGRVADDMDATWPSVSLPDNSKPAFLAQVARSSLYIFGQQPICLGEFAAPYI
ncbi:hypothetical protein VTK56DRAFT_6320 [Thermocarpiscus australiensis]